MHTLSLSRLLSISALLLSALVFCSPTHAAKVAGVAVEDSITVMDQALSLNGAGIRKKLFIKLYVGSLYTVNGSGSAAEIVDADETMAIRLNMLSDLLTRKKMIAALKDGFKKSTGGNTASIQAGIDQLIDVMPEKIRPGTEMTLAYEPGVGTHLMDGDNAISMIPGLEFKQALFGIWLSAKPAQKSLKSAMIGK